MNIASKSSFVLNRRHLLGIEGLSHEEIVGLLVLVLPGREGPATLRTRDRVVGPRVHDLDHGERGLVARTVAAARRGFADSFAD